MSICLFLNLSLCAFLSVCVCVCVCVLEFVCISCYVYFYMYILTDRMTCYRTRLNRLHEDSSELGAGVPRCPRLPFAWSGKDFPSHGPIRCKSRVCECSRWGTTPNARFLLQPL